MTSFDHKGTMKTHYEIEYFYEYRREWRNFDGCRRSKKRGILLIKKYRKDPYHKTYKLRLVEVTKRVVRI